MEEELLKKDPLQKPKKITVGVVVVVLVVLMVGVFVSFHWIYSDYFRYKANENEAQAKLTEVRVRCAEEEAAAGRRLEESVAKAKSVEEESARRVAKAEKDCGARIEEAEKNAQQRVAALDAEYEQAKKVKENELANDCSRRKEELASLLRGYEEQYISKTNAMTVALLEMQIELERRKGQIELLPDLRAQCETASNECVVARRNRDGALAHARQAQEEYNDWVGKIGQAKVGYEALLAKKAVLEKELYSLVSRTNEAAVGAAKLDARIEGLEGQVGQKKAELGRLAETIEADKKALESLRIEIGGYKKNRESAKGECKAAEAERAKAIEERNQADVARGEAQTKRESAEREQKQAEGAYEKRKAEIARLAKELEDSLAQKRTDYEKRKKEIEGLIKAQEELLRKVTKKVEAAVADPILPSVNAEGGNK